jgi:hypothetical protein
MKVAICYYGLLRSFDKVIDSHKKHIYDVFTKNNISFDVFFHTWKIEENADFQDPVEVKTQTAMMKILLERPFTRIQISDQLSYFQSFGKNLYNLKPYNPYVYRIYTLQEVKEHYRLGPDIPDDVLINLSDKKGIPFRVFQQNNTYYVVNDCNYVWYLRMIAGCESEKQSVLLSYKNNVDYDYYFLIRPDIIIYEDIDINSILTMPDNTIMLMNEKSYDGYNDRIAFCSKSAVEAFAFRGDKIIQYRDYRFDNPESWKVHPGDSPEYYLKYCLDSENVNIKKYDFLKFDIIRSDGTKLST